MDAWTIGGVAIGYTDKAVMDSGTSLLAVPSDAIKAYLLAYHCGAALYPSPASLLLLFLYSLPSSISGPCSTFTLTPSVLYFHPSFPGPASSRRGAGLGAPVIPPSRAGFPLRPRPLEGPGVSSPRLTVPRPRVARAPCSRVAGVIVPASGP